MTPAPPPSEPTSPSTAEAEAPMPAVASDALAAREQRTLASEQHTLALKQRKLSRRTFMKRGLGGLAALGLGSWMWGAGFECKWVEVTGVTHRVRRLSRAWDGVRLLQLSDIHLDDWMTRRRLESLVTLANQQSVDMIVITGDYSTHDPPEWETTLRECLQVLRAPLGVYGILGNHDQDTKHDRTSRALTAAGITVLNNAVKTFTREGASLHLTGVDDVLWGAADLVKVLEELPEEGAAVLLAHEPDFADTASRFGRFDVQLSGHSHGGQIRVPGVGPIHLPELGRRFPAGLYQVDTLSLYTNRGLGMVGPHLRLFCRPEMTIHTLRCA